MPIPEVTKETHTAALRKIADRINERDRTILMTQFFGHSDVRDENARKRSTGETVKATGQANWRQFADCPPEVHRFFEKQYGKDFWKDKEFWKSHPEWLTVNPWEL